MADRDRRGVLLVWLVGFVFWAGLAPLNGAVVASGTFVATGQNKLVQHLEGGIIRDLLVKEGDRVEAGQALVRMDETSAGARLRRLVLKEVPAAGHAGAARGRDEGERPHGRAGGLARSATDPEVRAIIDRQRTELRGPPGQPLGRGAGAQEGDRRPRGEHRRLSRPGESRPSSAWRSSPRS